MLKIIALCILTSVALKTNCQSVKDTVKVTVNGQTATVEDLRAGKKTTLTFEDSSSVFQISISKFSKKNEQKAKVDQKSTPETNDRESTHWLSEVSLGIITNPFATYSNSFMSLPVEDYTFFSSNFNPDIKTATLAKFESVKVNPGFRFELFLKEKRRKLGKSGLYLIRGLRAQFNLFTMSCVGTFNTYKKDLNGNIYSDSLVGSYSTEINPRIANYKLCLPVMIEKQFKPENKITALQFGLVLAFNNTFNSYQFKGVANTRAWGNTLGSPFVTTQSAIRILYKKRLTFTLTYDNEKTWFGFGQRELFSTHQLCFGLGWRFY